jgi:hypothetical protein
MHLSMGTVVCIAVLAVSFGVAVVLHYTRAGAKFKEHVPDRPQRRILLAGFGFVVTFAIVRGLAWSIHDNIGPFRNVEMSGRHIHHMVWGILLLLLTGFAWVLEIGDGASGSSAFMGRLMALLYGAGAAMSLDEFALWLNLEDVYWAREGRESIEAAMVFFVLCLMAYIVTRAESKRKRR